MFADDRVRRSHLLSETFVIPTTHKVRFNYDVSTHKVFVACSLSFVVKNKGVLKVTGSHVHFKSGSVLKTILDKDVQTKVHKQEVICHRAI